MYAFPNIIPQTYCPQALALFARMSTPPTNARKVLINALIQTLIQGVIWPTLDALWVMAAADSQAARLNWVSTSYTLTANGSPTFTTDRGYTGSAGSSTVYLDTGFNPASGGTQLSQNSSQFSVWSRTTAATADAQGQINGATQVGLTVAPRLSGDTFIGKANDNTNISSANADGSGFYTISRTASNAKASYKNGSQQTTASTASTTPYSANVYLLANNRSDGVAGNAEQLAAASLGSGLNSTQAGTLYTALQTYMTAVGA